MDSHQIEKEGKLWLFFTRNFPNSRVLFFKIPNLRSDSVNPSVPPLKRISVDPVDGIGFNLSNRKRKFAPEEDSFEQVKKKSSFFRATIEEFSMEQERKQSQNIKQFKEDSNNVSKIKMSLITHLKIDKLDTECCWSFLWILQWIKFTAKSTTIDKYKLQS